MPEVNRIGFTELAGTEGAGDRLPGSKRVNIILVHGLRGHPFETWASSRKAGNEHPSDKRAVGPSSLRQKIKSQFKSTTPTSESSSIQKDSSSRHQKVFWPEDYLANDIGEARVWTYGYNADVIGGLFKANNKNSVSGHGRDLRVRLEREIDDENPIIFIAHSLGGIIVKDALWRSEACSKRTKLIVFLGTPHRGSTLASWGEIASNLARLALQDPHKKIVETLEVNNEVLDNIHNQFVEIVHRDDIKIHSFQEAQGITGMKGLHGKVVDDFSSKIGLPDGLETPESISANHMQMAKCKNRADESYRAIAGVLKQFLKGRSPPVDLPIRSATQTQQAEASSARQEADTSCVTASYHVIPFPRNQWFVGRSKKLAELEEKLITSDDCQKLALVGLGGVGKSQVALELAYTVKEQWPGFSIFWVPAVSAESLEQAYRDIATRCSITLDPTEEDPKESVRRYLDSDLAGKWLLIVDNADDEQIMFEGSSDTGRLTDYLPQSEKGLILFTTRHREMAVSLARNKVVEVHEMDQEEANKFLEKSLIQTDLLQDPTVVAELLSELAFLPLAIAQAAAYINAMQISIPEYLSLLWSTEQNTISLLSREFQDDTRYKNSRNAVAATWLVSFDRIRRSDPVAADLLSFMSCLENKAIPRSILPSVEPAELTMHAMGTLRAYAFVTRRGDSDVYDMHRLVHLATKIWLNGHGAVEALNVKVAAHLVKIFPSNAYTNRAIWREYFPHAFQFLRTTKTLDIEARYDLCMAVGSCLEVDGRIGEAVVWLTECFLWRQACYPEDHLPRLVSQYTLANAYLTDGQVRQAVKLFEKIVAIEGKENPHPIRLASQNALANAYLVDGQVRKAVKLLEHVVAIQEKTLQEDHPIQLASQHSLANAYEADGQVKQAVKLLEIVVAIKEKRLQEDYPSRLVSQHALANAYLADGQVKHAIKLLETVVAIQEKTLQEDHPDRLASQHALASADLADGQVKEAVKLLEQVVIIREKILQNSHPDRLTSQHRLASAYLADKQVKQAVKLLEQVVAIQEKILRENHPDRLASQHELASAYYADGQVEGAIKLLEEVVAIQEKVLAEDHRDRLASQHELARAYKADGQIKRAIKLLEKVVAMEKKVLAKDHPDRLISERVLQDMYAQQRSEIENQTETSAQ